MEIIEPSIKLEAITQSVENDSIQARLNVEKVIEKAGRTCFDQSTEILTDSGWKFVNTIKNTDNVLTYNREKSILEYQPANMVKQKFSGDMYESLHSLINFRVTENHRCIYDVSYKKKDNEKFKIASSFKEVFKKYKSVKMPKFFKECKGIINTDYDNEFKETVEVRRGSLPPQSKTFTFKVSDASLIIMAAYITEGHLKECAGTGRCVCITQSIDNKFFNIIETSLKKLGWKYHIDTDPRKPAIKHFILNGGIPMVNFFKKNFGKHSKYKHLPEWFRCLSVRQLNLLLKTLYLGDGSHSTQRSEIYLSISEELINQVQEIFVLIGKTASKKFIKDKSATTLGGIFYVTENLRSCYKVTRNKLKITNVKNELVYCPSTQNGIVCTRRKGFIQWMANCYKSEDKITPDSAGKFCEMIQTRNHMSVLEHCSATFRIICDRGVGYEIVRHRIAAYSQESTRYVNYNKKGMQFIRPSWVSREDINNSISYINTHSLHIDRSANLIAVDAFVANCMSIELLYNSLIEKGWKPQQARAVLPNCLKTEIVMTANFREWLHFLELRTSPQAHPDMQVIAKMIGNKLHEVSPVIFKKEYC